MNEEIYHTFIKKLNSGAVGTLEEALFVCAEPDIKSVTSTLMKNTLVIGDKTSRPDEALEINIQMSKATSLVNPTTLKKFARPALPKPVTGAVESQSQTLKSGDTQTEISANDSLPAEIELEASPLELRTMYVVAKEEDGPSRPTAKLEEHSKAKNGGLDDSDDEMPPPPPPGSPPKIHNKDESDSSDKEKVITKEDLVRAYKYGQSWVPVEEGTGEDILPTVQGLEIVGFSYESLVRLLLSPASSPRTDVPSACITSVDSRLEHGRSVLHLRRERQPSSPSGFQFPRSSYASIHEEEGRRRRQGN